MRRHQVEREWPGVARMATLLQSAKLKCVEEIAGWLPCGPLCMIDLTDVPDARLEDEVVLLGRSGDE